MGEAREAEELREQGFFDEPDDAFMMIGTTQYVKVPVEVIEDPDSWNKTGATFEQDKIVGAIINQLGVGSVIIDELKEDNYAR